MMFIAVSEWGAANFFFQFLNQMFLIWFEVLWTLKISDKSMSKYIFRKQEVKYNWVLGFAVIEFLIPLVSSLDTVIFLILPSEFDYFVQCCSFLRDGNLPDIVNSGSLHEFLVNLHERYGPVVSFWFGRRPVVSLGTVNVLKQHINPNKTCKFNFLSN